MSQPISININEIFENALKDPSLFSELDIDELLDSIENTKHDYLENKTTVTISTDIYEHIRELELPIIIVEEYCKKLVEYRYIDDIHELHKGKYVRWIRKTTTNNKNTLTNGGTVMDIKFLDNGIHILCKNPQHRFIQYKFDDCLTFQKMSTCEQLILMAYENI